MTARERIQNDEAVRELTDRLEVAEAELKAAEKEAAKLERATEGKEDEVLRLEALAEIGEHSAKDAQKRAAELEQARVGLQEARRSVKRKEYAVTHLREKLAQAEEAALGKVRQEYEERLNTALAEFAEAIRPAVEANEALAQAFEAYDGSGLRPPHESLAWHDLLDGVQIHTKRYNRHWRGDGASTKYVSRFDLWRDQARKHGYEV